MDKGIKPTDQKVLLPSFIHSITHSAGFLSSYYVPGTLLGAKVTVVNKKNHCPHGAYIPVSEMQDKKTCDILVL